MFYIFFTFWTLYFVFYQLFLMQLWFKVSSQIANFALSGQLRIKFHSLDWKKCCKLLSFLKGKVWWVDNKILFASKRQAILEYIKVQLFLANKFSALSWNWSSARGMAEWRICEIVSKIADSDHFANVQIFGQFMEINTNST